jgi:hypothetical protein
MQHYPLETSYFRPESEAMMAILDPESYIQQFIAPGELVVTFIQDDWQPYHRSNSIIEGHMDTPENSRFIQLSMSFPGMISRGLARLRHHEPSAIMNLTLR